MCSEVRAAKLLTPAERSARRAVLRLQVKRLARNVSEYRDTIATCRLRMLNLDPACAETPEASRNISQQWSNAEAREAEAGRYLQRARNELATLVEIV